MKVRRHAWRKLWLKLLSCNLLGRAIWIDESGFRTWMQRTHARSKCGRQVKSFQKSKSSHYTLVMAMSVSEVRAKWVFPKGLTYKRWDKFITKYLIDVLNEGEFIMLDNLNIHKQNSSRQILENKGVCVIDQPPYSPQCNPIEEAFSKIKIIVRGQNTTSAKTLRTAIDLAISKITRRNIEGWVRHAFRHIATWQQDFLANN